MAMDKPRRGDLIEVSQFLHSHWAVYVGDGYVVHLTDRGGFSGLDLVNTWSVTRGKATVKKELLSVVAGGYKYQINNKNDAKFTPLPARIIVQNAEQLVGQELVYDMISQNSKHFAKNLRYGFCCPDSDKPRPGDLIEVFRLLHSHWAIYVGGGYVVHLTDRSLFNARTLAGIGPVTEGKATVKKELLSMIAGQKEYQINNKDDAKFTHLPAHIIVQNAERLVGQELVYDMISQNSKHFAKNLRYGFCCPDSDKPRPGDLIEISRPLYNHWAIYVGDGYVVHLSNPSGLSGVNSASIGSSKTDKAKVKMELLYVVAWGYKYQINNKDDAKYTPLPPNMIVRQAKEMVGQELVYDLISHNCEHFVKNLRYRIPHGNQVTDAMAVGMRVLALGAMNIVDNLLLPK